MRPWMGVSFRYASVADSPDMSWLPLPRFESRVACVASACCSVSARARGEGATPNIRWK
jgi:hypothetical protein